LNRTRFLWILSRILCRSFIAFLSRLQNVCYRQALVAKAYERAKGYSWRRTAEKTLRVFQEVLVTSRT